MAQSHLKVVRVVRGSNLNNAGSEIRFNIIVRNNGDLTVNYRQNKCLAHKVLIAFVIRVYRNGGIAEQCFGACGGKLQVTAPVLKRVTQMPEMPCLLLVLNLRVGNRGLAMGAPVYYSFSPVYKSLFIKAYKYLVYSLVTSLVDRDGGVVLCNRQMYRLSQQLLRSDLQYMGELEEALAAPPEGVTPLEKMENTYRFSDGTVWKFEKSGVTDRYGTSYIQLTAADVTALHWALLQLAEDNRALERDAERMRRLSENVEAVAREKEQLAAKSAMHDSLAACITVTKQYLAGDLHGVDGEAVLREWEKSISFREALRLPAKETLYENARSSGVTVRVRGPEPVGVAAELLYAAMQVCLSNAVQYAQATELTAHIWEDGDRYRYHLCGKANAAASGQGEQGL